MTELARTKEKKGYAPLTRIPGPPIITGSKMCNLFLQNSEQRDLNDPLSRRLKEIAVDDLAFVTTDYSCSYIFPIWTPYDAPQVSFKALAEF